MQWVQRPPQRGLPARIVMFPSGQADAHEPQPTQRPVAANALAEEKNRSYKASTGGVSARIQRLTRTAGRFRPARTAAAARSICGSAASTGFRFFSGERTGNRIA